MKRFALITLVMLFANTLIFASKDFNVPPGRSSWPRLVTIGPDGNLWVAEVFGQKIARITLNGVITEFPIPGSRELAGISTGPDGSIWYTDDLANSVGHISVTGHVLGVSSVPRGSHPEGITKGPDGNLWFLEQSDGGFTKIGKITTHGTITEYATTLPSGPSATFALLPATIIAGPDGNLWFVNPPNLGPGDGQVGKITVNGLVTLYPLANQPVSITAGPDGNLWLTEFKHIAKLTTQGLETQYLLHTTATGPIGITAGPDGKLWFSFISHVGNITTGGVITISPIENFGGGSGIVSAPDHALWLIAAYDASINRFDTNLNLTNAYHLNAGSNPTYITTGPDGAVWFSESNPAGIRAAIGRIDANGVVTSFPLPDPPDAPRAIASGSDGNIWFFEGFESIGRMTPSGVLTGEFPLNSENDSPENSLILAPDGNLWFTEADADGRGYLGRITPSGQITDFPLPNLNGYPQAGITIGSDGNLWFPYFDAADNPTLDALTTSGALLHEYPVPDPAAFATSVSTGSDGNLWFPAIGNPGSFWKVTPTGAFTRYLTPVANEAGPLHPGMDGALWFAEGDATGRIDTEGIISHVQLSITNGGPDDLVFGPDGRMWVTDFFGGAISRLSASRERKPYYCR